MFPRNENRNEGTFAKTTLLRNRPFISRWHRRQNAGIFKLTGRWGKTTPKHKRLSSLNKGSHFKVPEGHYPRGTTLREALQGNLPLRGFSAASAGVSSRVLRGLCGTLRGSAGYSEGNDPILVTLGNCWIVARPPLLTVAVEEMWFRSKEAHKTKSHKISENPLDGRVSSGVPAKIWKMRPFCQFF